MLRRRQRLRQRDVAARVGVSQQHVSDLERGQLGGMTLDGVADLFKVLDARVTLTVHWRGGQLDRLLDEVHAAVVGAACRELQAKGWEVVPELTYAVYREQGSIDVLAWHRSTRIALVVEVKTEITSLEELLRRHDAKVRLAPSLCRDRFGAAPSATTGCLSWVSPRRTADAWRRSIPCFVLRIPRVAPTSDSGSPGRAEPSAASPSHVPPGAV